MQTTDPSNLWRTETDLALEDARREKSERTKDLGSPITLPGKPLDIVLEKNECWIAESTAVVRRVNLETGKTIQVFKGHAGPVTCIKIYKNKISKDQFIISGSWDRTIKIWSTKDGTLISTTEAHSDFVKTLLIVPELRLLVSSGSDKVVRFWDLTNILSTQPLPLLGVLSAHLRPVQCLYVEVESNNSATLYTADTMGVINVSQLERRYGETSACRATIVRELNHHRTGINDMWYHKGMLWTASLDESVGFVHDPPKPNVKAIPPLQQSTAVKAILPLICTELEEPYILVAVGDVIRIYDVSSLEEPEFVQEIDAHWHHVISLRLWYKVSLGEDGKQRVEPWIISASLDGTIRKWRLEELLKPITNPTSTLFDAAVDTSKINQSSLASSQLTAEEEQELAELMDSD